jgi:hypothetical protein
MKLFPSRRSVAMQRGTTRPLFKVLLTAVFLVTSLLTVTGPPMATAAVQYEFSAIAGELCDFPVRIVVNDNTKIVENDASQVYSTGAIKITVTNTEPDGRTKGYNISGPTFDNGTLTGPALILQPASAGLGDPFLIINYGRVTFNEDRSIDTIIGKQTDICAQLA